MGSAEFKGNLSVQEIYNVYKLVYMPVDILFMCLRHMDAASLKIYYRQLALIVHPDKNGHAMAGQAF